jgi:hypothetical protein
MNHTFSPNPKIVKKSGNVSFDENKVRIRYSDGMDSVLFEDIASVSYCRAWGPNYSVILLAILIFILFIVLAFKIPSLYALFLGLIISIITLILAYTRFKHEWENVIVESRGGGLFLYSTDLYKGHEQVELIEEERRKNNMA